jgi:predicted phosphoribosyltransferase
MDTVACTRPRKFANSREAGALLAQQLRRFSGGDDVVVRNLGFPGQPELAMGDNAESVRVRS